MVGPPEAHANVDTPLPSFGRSGLTLAALFVVVALGSATVGRVYYDAQKAFIVAQTSLELSAIRDLKIDQVAQWRAGLIADGRAVTRDPTIARDLSAWLSDAQDAAAVTVLREWIAALAESQGYEGGVLVSADGSRWVTSSEATEPDSSDRAETAAALGSSDAILTDLFLDPASGRPRLDVVAPIRAGENNVKAVLVLRRDPARDLYPLMRNWPGPSPTAETLLVRRDGGEVLYLNDLRFREGGALRTRMPMADGALISAQAMSGGSRVVEGTDYRGAAAVAAVGPVKGCPWFVIAKVDPSEAYASVLSTQWTTLLGVGLILLVTGLGLGLAWRQRATAFYRSALQAERRRDVLSARYDLLGRFANDAIVVVDMEHRLNEVNDAAIQLYGYTREQLLGMRLEDLSWDKDRSAVAAHFDAIAAEGASRFETRHVRCDGTVFVVEASARRVGSNAGDLIVMVLRDVTAARDEAEDLRSSRDYVEQLIDYASAPIIVWNGDGIITRFNFGFERLTGRKSADLVGRPLGTLFPDEARDAFLALIGQTLEDESRGIVEIPILHADGRQLIVLWNSSNIFAKDGTTLLATIAQGVDITERKAAEEELLQRTEALAKSNAELERFAYVASHDLQEPLRMVASYTQLLAKRYQGRLDDDADEFIGFAVGGATRMQSLINELLAYSRVGTRARPFESVDLETLLATISHGLGMAIGEAGATVTHDPMPTIVCDSVQIGQVFQNLIANALKFHREDAPAVHVGAKRGNGRWVFSVSDNGMGIEEQYFEKVFVIFQRLESRAEYPGTGMGLAICKKIVERHGGNIQVESTIGVGTTFRFDIPDMSEGEQHA